MCNYEAMVGRLYALDQMVDEGYTPTEHEAEWMEFAREKIEDWSTDVEAVF